MTDPIADMIVRLKSGAKSKKDVVSFNNSKLVAAVLDTLHRIGYVEIVSKKGKKISKQLEAKLIYSGGNPKFSDAKRISKPSKRMYRGYKKIQPVKSGFGHLIISTPNGILTDVEARKQKVGGETLFKIW